MYADMYIEKDLDNMQREGVKSRSLKGLQTYAADISNNVNNFKKWRHYTGILPELFNPLCFFDDTRYLRGHRTLQIVKNSNR